MKKDAGASARLAVAVFLLFAFLFLNTEYKDNDVLPYAVNLFLRLDPLMAGAATLAGRAIIGLVLARAGRRAPHGRAGPLLLRMVLPARRRDRRRGCDGVPEGPTEDAVPVSWRRYKFLILFFLAASSLFTLQWVFLFDPISILIRTFTVSVFPALNLVLHQIFDGLYRSPGPIPRVSEPVYGFLKAPFPRLRASRSSGPPRSWGSSSSASSQRSSTSGGSGAGTCAPRGAAGAHGTVRALPAADHGGGLHPLRPVRSGLPHGAIGGDVAVTDHGECIECMDCQAICPREVIHFSGKEGRKPAAVDLTRRGVLASAALRGGYRSFFRVEAHGKRRIPC